jgi:predicted NACHT family NTPase
LHHLAIQCNQGNVAADRIPIFVPLKDFAETSRNEDKFRLLNYLRDELFTSGITDPHIIESVLLEGKALLLLDGIDELLNSDRNAVLKEVRKFSDRYHKNLFVVTCRTANPAFKIRQFIDVEIAPFTLLQITTFSRKWFLALTQTTSDDGLAQSDQFIQELGLPENWQIYNLATIPLFLHLACWMFRHQGNFLIKRAEFYKQCLDTLLFRWDEARGVERDHTHQGLSLAKKINLLSQIAFTTFEQSHYIFEQRIVEFYIRDYLCNLPNAPTDLEELQLNSATVLKTIEVQNGLLIERARGIFSFSHLAFQEYLTARKIVANYQLDSSENVLEELVNHITNPRWREVFLLTVSMLHNADSLVLSMKQWIDAMVAQDSHLQEFLVWASQQDKPQPWLQTDYTLCSEWLRRAIDQYQEFNQHWKLTPKQQQVLHQYYDANTLLFNCLNSRCEVTATVRQTIEATALLPPERT